MDLCNRGYNGLAQGRTQGSGKAQREGIPARRMSCMIDKAQYRPEERWVC